MNPKLLKKFLSNQCTAEESEAVYKWLEENPEEMDRLFSEEEWESYMDAHEQSVNKGSVWTKVGVSFVLVVASYIFWNTWDYKQELDIAYQQHTFFYNQSDTLQLIQASDGSTIHIHPEGLLLVDIHPDKKTRKIELKSGKAFFVVAKDRQRPFVVEGGVLRTTALGTQFSVEVTGTDLSTHVKLKEGKIRVERIQQQAEALVLKPGEEINASARLTGMTLLAHNISTPISTTQVAKDANTYIRSPHILIADHHLEIDKVPLAEVLQYLHHELDMHVQYDQKQVEGYLVTGQFIMQEDNYREGRSRLGVEVLQLVTELNPFVLIEENNKLILQYKP